MPRLHTTASRVIPIFIIGTLALVAASNVFPRAAHAQVVAVPTSIITNISPTEISNTKDSLAQWLKSFTLDHLATLIAKQILHQMTLSVINWINSGYKGSPGFITNPSQFFENAADQVTGAMIAEGGPLSQLCSPWSVNIRVGLALQQSQLSNQKYACTLDTIIKDASNTTISVNGQKVNGNGGINSFLAGNFSQGGWPAFISMTTEPQNNPYGSYLMAQSDLQVQITLRRAALTFDLQLGQGFLSWNSCSDITGQITGSGDLEGATDALYNNGATDSNIAQAQQKLLLSQNKNQNFQTGQDNFGDATSIQEQVNPTSGATTYQNCTVQTPGSVIASEVKTSAMSPIVELELANDINAVINAAVTQLTSTMLSQGLNSLSGNSGGGATSYTSQALQSVLNQTQAGVSAAQSQVSTEFTAQASSSVDADQDTYTSAISIATSTENSFEIDRQCFVNLMDATPPSLNTYQTGLAQTDISGIDAYVSAYIDPVITNLFGKENTLNSSLTAVTNATAAVGSGNPATLDDLQNQLPAYQNVIQTSVDADAAAGTASQAAQSDLSDTQTKMNAAATVASQYATACQNLPSMTAPPPTGAAQPTI